MKKLAIAICFIVLLVVSCGSPTGNPTYRIDPKNGDPFVTKEYRTCQPYAAKSQLTVYCYKTDDGFYDNADYVVEADSFEIIDNTSE